MKTRTLIIALAVTVPEDFKLDNRDITDYDLWAEQFDMAGITSDDSAIVSVLDRDQPKHNYEPQIFAAYEEKGDETPS